MQRSTTLTFQLSLSLGRWLSTSSQAQLSLWCGKERELWQLDARSLELQILPRLNLEPFEEISALKSAGEAFFQQDPACQNFRTQNCHLLIVTKDKYSDKSISTPDLFFFLCWSCSGMSFMAVMQWRVLKRKLLFGSLMVSLNGAAVCTPGSMRTRAYRINNFLLASIETCSWQ